MVKEEDKGRGFMTVQGMNVFFSSGILLDHSGNAIIITGKQGWNKKNPCLRFFSKFFNIIVHKLPS
jgi:hypothetical protein